MERLIATDKRQRTLRNLKTATMLRSRSKPPIEGQSYLDLYVLQRDRARWNRLKQQAEQMIASIDLALRKLGLPECAPSAAGSAVASAEPPRPVARGLDFKVCSRRKRLG